MGDQQVITLNDGVFLYGDGPRVSQIFWSNNSAVPSSPLVTTLGRFAIEGVGLYLLYALFF